MTPVTEFRTCAVEGPPPADRTTAGRVVGAGDVLDLGRVDTTDEARDMPVTVLWWRIADMNGCTEVKNIRIRVTGAEALTGSGGFTMDITDTWTAGKMPVEVATGSPGTAPTAPPGIALERMGGGPITGTGHDQTSRYIYLSGSIGVNEPVGVKSGLGITVTYDSR